MTTMVLSLSHQELQLGFDSLEALQLGVISLEALQLGVTSLKVCRTLSWPKVRV